MGGTGESGPCTPPAVVLLGPPGAGKGTQAARLVEERGLLHVSTGEALRRSIASGSELGREVRDLVESGRLVPDETVAAVVGAVLDELDTSCGILFDGFPRTVDQVRRLDELLATRGLGEAWAIELDVPEEVVAERLSSRRSCREHGPQPAGRETCSRCGEDLYVRADDQPDVVAERLRVHREQTAPVAAVYEERARLLRVDGDGPLEEVYGRVRETFDRHVMP